MPQGCVKQEGRREGMQYLDDAPVRYNWYTQVWTGAKSNAERVRAH